MKHIFPLLLSLLVVVSSSAEDKKDGSASPIVPGANAPAVSDSKTNKCVLLYATGTVEISESGKKEWKIAKLYQELKPGDKIRTSDKSRAAVRLASSSVLRVPASTTFEVPASAIAKK